MTFDYIFRLEITGYSWGFFIISVGHYIFGFHFLYKKIFSFKNNEALINKSTYQENRQYFYAEYDRCNPITQEKASREYIRYLKSKLIFLKEFSQKTGCFEKAGRAYWSYGV